MKGGYDKKDLDLIGKRLFDHEPLPASVIDDIVTKPDLFSLVRERIAADNAASLATQRRRTASRRHVIAYSGMALTLVAAAGAIGLFRPAQQPKATTPMLSTNIPDAVPEVARPEVPPQPIMGKLSAGRAAKDEIKEDVRGEKAILTRVEPVNRQRRDAEPDTQFLPVSYTGDPDETSAGGQVIRVEMKRSSLFAIGVDIPLENDDSVVKADILIGRDGVTRAIRVID